MRGLLVLMCSHGLCALLGCALFSATTTPRVVPEAVPMRDGSRASEQSRVLGASLEQPPAASPNGRSHAERDRIEIAPESLPEDLALGFDTASDWQANEVEMEQLLVDTRLRLADLRSLHAQAMVEFAADELKLDDAGRVALLDLAVRTLGARDGPTDDYLLQEYAAVACADDEPIHHALPQNFLRDLLLLAGRSSEEVSRVLAVRDTARSCARVDRFLANIRSVVILTDGQAERLRRILSETSEEAMSSELPPRNPEQDRAMLEALESSGVLPQANVTLLRRTWFYSGWMDG